MSKVIARTNADAINAYAVANSVTPAQAKTALKAMSDSEFATFVLDTFGDDDVDDIVECKPSILTFNGTVTSAVENDRNYARRKDDKGVHGLVTLTVSDIETGRIHTVNCTIAQYGYDDVLETGETKTVRGFGIKAFTNKAMEFTVEQRLADTTTYTDANGVLKHHERTGETLVGVKVVADSEVDRLIAKRNNADETAEIMSLYKAGLPTEVLNALIGARAQVRIATIAG